MCLCFHGSQYDNWYRCHPTTKDETRAITKLLSNRAICYAHTTLVHHAARPSPLRTMDAAASGAGPPPLMTAASRTSYGTAAGARPQLNSCAPPPSCSKPSPAAQPQLLQPAAQLQTGQAAHLQHMPDPSAQSRWHTAAQQVYVAPAERLEDAWSSVIKSARSAAMQARVAAQEGSKRPHGLLPTRPGEELSSLAGCAPVPASRAGFAPEAALPAARQDPAVLAVAPPPPQRDEPQRTDETPWRWAFAALEQRNRELLAANEALHARNAQLEVQRARKPPPEQALPEDGQRQRIVMNETPPSLPPLVIGGCLPSTPPQRHDRQPCVLPSVQSPVAALSSPSSLPSPQPARQLHAARQPQPPTNGVHARLEQAAHSCAEVSVARRGHSKPASYVGLHEQAAGRQGQGMRSQEQPSCRRAAPPIRIAASALSSPKQSLSPKYGSPKYDAEHQKGSPVRSTSSEPSPSKREVMHAYAERQRALMRQQRLEHRRRNAPLGAGCKGEHAAHAGLMRPCAAKHAVARPPPARSNGCTSANGCTAVSAMPSARALVAHAPRAAPSSRSRHASSSSAAAPSGLADDAQLGYDDEDNQPVGSGACERGPSVRDLDRKLTLDRKLAWTPNPARGYRRPQP